MTALAPPEDGHGLQTLGGLVAAVVEAMADARPREIRGSLRPATIPVVTEEVVMSRLPATNTMPWMVAPDARDDLPPGLAYWTTMVFPAHGASTLGGAEQRFYLALICHLVTCQVIAERPDLAAISRERQRQDAALLTAARPA